MGHQKKLLLRRPLSNFSNPKSSRLSCEVCLFPGCVGERFNKPAPAAGLIPGAASKVQVSEGIGIGQTSMQHFQLVIPRLRGEPARIIISDITIKQSELL